MTSWLTIGTSTGIPRTLSLRAKRKTQIRPGCVAPFSVRVHRLSVASPSSRSSKSFGIGGVSQRWTFWPGTPSRMVGEKMQPGQGRMPDLEAPVVRSRRSGARRLSSSRRGAAGPAGREGSSLGGSVNIRSGAPGVSPLLDARPSRCRACCGWCGRPVSGWRSALLHGVSVSQKVAKDPSSPPPSGTASDNRRDVGVDDVRVKLLVGALAARPRVVERRGHDHSLQVLGARTDGLGATGVVDPDHVRVIVPLMSPLSNGCRRGADRPARDRPTAGKRRSVDDERPQVGAVAGRARTGCR